MFNYNKEKFDLMLSRILNNLDLFSLPVVFLFDKRKNRSSTLGLLYSFGIYTFLLLSFFQSDLFQKNSPLVISQTIQSNHSRQIEFNDNKFFTFFVADANKYKYNDPSLFTFQFKVWNIQSDEKGGLLNSHSDIRGFHSCEVDDVSFNPELYSKLQLKNSNCLKNKTFLLEGDYDELDLKNIVINLLSCDNLTSNNTCKAQTEIDSFFSKRIYFGIQFHDSMKDLGDYDNPYKIAYKTDYMLLDQTLNKRLSMKIKTSEIVSDTGWIFPSYVTEHNFMFDTKDFDFVTRKASDPLGQIIVYASKNIDKNSRRYQKLPETLGSLMGMTNLIMAVCFVMTNFVNHVLTLKFVLNKLYCFPYDENLLKKEEFKPESLFKKNMPSIGENQENSTKNYENAARNPNQIKAKTVDLTNIQPKIIKQDSFILEKYSQENIAADLKVKNKGKNSQSPSAAKIFQRIKLSSISYLNVRKKSEALDTIHQKPDKLTMGYLEYLYTLLLNLFKLKLSRKKKIILKAESLYNEEIDLITILLRLQDIEKIKRIMFDEDQLILFDYLSKPVVVLEEEEEFKEISMSPRMIVRNKKNDLKINLAESYRKVASNKENSNVNKRMIMLIDDKLLHFKQ